MKVAEERFEGDVDYAPIFYDSIGSPNLYAKVDKDKDKDETPNLCYYNTSPHVA